MKNKFVLGIVAVVCLQICFQVFNAVKRSDERYNQVRASTPVVSPVDILPIEIAEVPASEEYVEQAFTAPVRELQPMMSPRRVAVRAEKAAIHTNRAPLFETVRITYTTHPSVPLTHTAVKAAVRTEHPGQTQPEVKKERSVIARALPIVKKPYEFFKLVGSKLR